MLIGLGGGAASSMASGEGQMALDFASVQRDNAEMQRRCQEVINACTRLGPKNPILSIHDVGAGGLSNAFPELVHADARGARLDLRAIPSAEPSLSPMEIWSNEAQERYVLGITIESLAKFKKICARERCPFAVVGEVIASPTLSIDDAVFGNRPVDVPLDLVLGEPPRMRRTAVRRKVATDQSSLKGIQLADAAKRVLQLPAVADKSFLITIGDRTVGGLVVRDPFVGRWQIPVADCAVTANGFSSYHGEVMAIGERTPLAAIDAPASGRVAIAEALTNLAAAPVPGLDQVALSANWMAACGDPGEDAALFDTVRTVALDICPALGITIPVGKDSLSMQTEWQEGETASLVRSPVSLIVSAFAPCQDVRHVLTPELQPGSGTQLIVVDLSGGQARLGGSALMQVFERGDGPTPDLDSPATLRQFFEVIQTLTKANKLLAYHDRSDGGLFVTLCEMAFAGHRGVEIDLSPLGAFSENEILAILFSEELGAVLQVDAKHTSEVLASLRGIQGSISAVIGQPCETNNITIRTEGTIVFSSSRRDLHRLWSETSYRMQRARDDEISAEEAFSIVGDEEDPGLSVSLSFQWPNLGRVGEKSNGEKDRPPVAVLREQGVNGHLEMGAAFDRAGFDCYDVHMSELIKGQVQLSSYVGLAACGGFSYGDVLGAGRGWANTILFNDLARDAFTAFFNRTDAFTLGVCNGCQMLSNLTELIPGSTDWPRFIRNRSEQFESRLVMAELLPSPSIFFTDMVGSLLPVVVAHGEGQVAFPKAKIPPDAGNVCVRFVDNHYHVTETYPHNPNGSPGGITGITNDSGRVTIMMPHPERLFRTIQHSWHPNEWGEDGPWMKMFDNARVWVG